MATARPKRPPSKPIAKPKPVETRAEPWALRAFDAVFRFLASLKLAVIMLTSLATVLAYGTFYEKANGTQAVQIDIYQSKWFALLMAMLGINILCAALIRFPWKKRQTGFVITHAGLITLLVGSFMSIKMTDEGEVYIDEGKSSHTFVRENHPIIRVESLDPRTGQPSTPISLPFRPGASAWESEKQEALARDPGHELHTVLTKGVVGTLAVLLIASAGVVAWKFSAWVNRFWGALTVACLLCTGCVITAVAWSIPIGPRRDVLTEPNDPFRVVVKDYLPSATPPRERHEPAADGVPMLRSSLFVRPPGRAEEENAWGNRGWVVPTKTLKHGVLKARGFPLEYHFQMFDGPRGAEALADFLDVPQHPLSDHRVRFHYKDRDGKSRVYDWMLTPEEAAVQLTPVPGAARTLPDSDLAVSFQGLSAFPLDRAEAVKERIPELGSLLEEMAEALNAREVVAAAFKIKSSNGGDENYFAWAGLPLAPNVLSEEGRPKAGNVRLDYYRPPALAAAGGNPMEGLRAAIDIVRGPDGRFSYRVVNTEGLKGLGPIQIGERISALGGAGRAMQLSLRLDEFLTSGRTRIVCEELPLEPNDRVNGSPAALVEFTADGITREKWLYLERGLGPREELFPTRQSLYRLALDYEHGSLDYDVHLVDFDAQFDPGSTARSTYRSDVTVAPVGTGAKTPVVFSELAENGYFQFMERPRETFRKLSATTYEPLDRGEIITVDTPESLVTPCDTPIKIFMNNPMHRKGWTFFQSSFRPVRDPETFEETGDQTTILSSRYDPAWPVIYGGVILVVIGSFVQFYLRPTGSHEASKRDALASRAPAKSKPSDRHQKPAATVDAEL